MLKLFLHLWFALALASDEQYIQEVVANSSGYFRPFFTNCFIIESSNTTIPIGEIKGSFESSLLEASLIRDGKPYRWVIDFISPSNTLVTEGNVVAKLRAFGEYERSSLEEPESNGSSDYISPQVPLVFSSFSELPPDEFLQNYEFSSSTESSSYDLEDLEFYLDSD